MNNRLVSKIIDYILNILIVFFAIFLMISMYTAFQIKILKNEYSNFFGYSLFEVQTGSMKKAIKPGDWIITKKEDEIEIGDIVTYKQDNEFITHRVIEKYKGTFVTKGDANNTKDNPIDQSQIVGKVVKTLHGFGILRKTIFNPFVLITLIITLYLFNLTFKPGKTKFDQYVNSFIELLKKKIKKQLDKKTENKQPKEENIIVKTIEQEPEKIDIPIKEYQKEEPKEEELSKTAMFRVVTIKDEEEPKEEIKEEPKEELEKTSMYRIISVDASDLGKEKPKQEKKEKTKKDKIEVVNIKLSAEKIEEPKDKYYNITKELIKERIQSKKAKNIIEKYFDIKKIIYDEIMNVLSYNEKVYIKKSSLKQQFINEYMLYRYFDSNSNKNFNELKKQLLDYSDELRYKNIRDEKQLNIISFYTNAIMLISMIDNKYDKENLENDISKIMNYNEETISNIVLSIDNIIKYSYDYLNEILEKLKTNTFDAKYNKINGTKNIYGSVLKHNITFSKVYSEYIVDKTYSEGKIAEDKIAVLLNLVLCKVVNDLVKGDYESKYIIYIPEGLYGKDKKLDKIASIIDNEYTKESIYFLTSLTNMLKNKDDIKRLRKKGYNFALLFDKKINLESEDLGYVQLAQYYFIDSREQDLQSIYEIIPNDILNKIVKDDMKLKIDYDGGE